MSTIQQTLVEMFNLDTLPPEESAEMVDRLAKLVFQAVLVRALPLLPEPDFEQYEKIVEDGLGGEALLDFLAEKVPSFGNIISEESENLRAELAGNFGSIGQ